MRYFILTLVEWIALLPTTVSFADIAYSSAGSTYSQDFDGLAISGTGVPWIDDSTLPGWFTNATSYNANPSATNSSTGIHSFGDVGSTERALGSVGSGPLKFFGVRFTNNTSTPITSFSVTYDGEQWRKGNTSTVQTITFSFLVGNEPTISQSGYTNFPDLNFSGPISTGARRALDGNLAENRTPGILATVTDIVWAPGQQLFLRWTDKSDSGDHGLAIDNFSFSTAAVPEVSAFACVGIVSLLTLVRRRRCLVR